MGRVQRNNRRRLTLAVAAACMAAYAVVPASAAARCTGSSAPGGDWPQITGAGLGQNAQPGEKRIGPSTVARLKLAWTSPPTAFQSIPVVAGRCAYYTDAGYVAAVDLRTGRQVWRTSEPLPFTEYAPFGVAVEAGRVHIGYDNKLSPQAAAFDADTGRRLWTSKPVRFDHDAWQLSSAVTAKGLQLFTTTGPDWDASARPGFAVLDARTGRTLTQRTTIPAKDLAKGFAGGGIWGTPVVDPATLYAYAGTSNPYSKTREHAYDNAIVKIDMNPKRRTFGQVVASYKGDPDVFVDALYQSPVCQQQEGEDGLGAALMCLQQDVDFGNSPTLWRRADGTLLLSQIQKSGVLHTMRASDLKPVWKATLGTNSLLTLTGGNHGNAATDGKRLFVLANPGLLYAVDATTGVVSWTAPVADGIMSKNVAVANGVVYATDARGVHGYDAATGEPLWQFAGSDAGLNCAGETGGVAVARGHVVVSCSGTLAAFRLP